MEHITVKRETIDKLYKQIKKLFRNVVFYGLIVYIYVKDKFYNNLFLKIL